LVVICWVMVTVTSAYFYAYPGVTSAGDLYARSWGFQLLAFAIFRLWFFAAGLAVALWLALRLFRENPPNWFDQNQSRPLPAPELQPGGFRSFRTDVVSIAPTLEAASKSCCVMCA